ncbi:MAG: sulfatase-like hydrolase/transferase, partial [Verrucomicrobiae bacterium]|nr:sulfatase-like hydrolase/transferase [Verrucomicrobiae bacterium]
SLPENFLPEHSFDNGELYIRDEKLLPKPLEAGTLKREIAAYYGMISHHDEQIGKVLTCLEENGEFSNTIIVYLSDHGLALGKHGLLGKQNLYEHSIRVPLILTGPGVPKNSVHEECIYSMDLPSLLYRLSECPSPDGKDSLPSPQSAFPDSTFSRKTIFALYKDVQRSIRIGDWKLILYVVENEKCLQLFNLKEDPFELQDLAANPVYSNLISQLTKQLRNAQESNGDPCLKKFHP